MHAERGRRKKIKNSQRNGKYLNLFKSFRFHSSRQCRVLCFFKCIFLMVSMLFIVCENLGHRASV